MSLVLGIDGGGTKTVCAIARDGRILASSTTGPSNLLRFPEEDVKAALQGAIMLTCASAGLHPDEIDAACVGVAGAAREAIRTKVYEFVTDVLSCEVDVIGDMMIAYDAGHRGGPGMIVIAGTGSIAYGQNERGESARSGGWGSVISDEGSGYWIGRNAVAAAFKALDSGRSTTLIEHVMRRWKVVTKDDLIRMANSNPQPNFAELAPAVFETAAAGDQIAQELLTDAGAELAKLAKVVLRRLWPGPHAVDIVVLGGLFEHSKFLVRVFENSVRAERPTATIRLLQSEPVDGALFRAEQLAKAESEREAHS